MSDRSFVHWIDRKTGFTWRTEFCHVYDLHRPEKEGPAVIERFRTSGKVHVEEYYLHNRLHRQKGPARIVYDENGSVIAEKFYLHGSLHRDPQKGPAEIGRNPANSVLVYENYFLYGEPYRRPSDGPYRITRDALTGMVTGEFRLTAEQANHPPPPTKFNHQILDDKLLARSPSPKPPEVIADTFVQWINRETGFAWRQEFRTADGFHRSESEGPAVVERFDATGEILLEEYYWQGKLHREVGPAKAMYTSDRETDLEEYHLHGLLHRDPLDGPAYINRDSLTPGVANEEEYFLYGKPYRRPEDGPFRITRNDDTGEITRQWVMTAEQASRVPQPPKGFPAVSTRKGPSPS